MTVFFEKKASSPLNAKRDNIVNGLLPSTMGKQLFGQ